MHVVATAGHVDHGKSTLVRVLTGTDPDRWEEEKVRGLTIDLGFATTELPSGRSLAFVDVPGHVRFLKNMLAGVGAVDACLFVVAATEGWKPQSEEHLRILELLGIDSGLVALTKIGLVDDDHRHLGEFEVADHLTGTFLEGAEVVGVDAPTGRGVAELRLALDRLLATTPRAPDRDRPRLWVDRSFAAKGAGTVVTGTLTGGTLAVGDELTLLPAERAVRVRALQSHGESLPSAAPGRRVAVNVAGPGRGAPVRGDALVRPRQWHRTRTFDASIVVLGGLTHDVSRRGAYLAYLGTGEHPARLRILGPAALAPGEAGLARIDLPTALPLLPGDRYVLRESGRDETVGGGEVLDVDPVLTLGKAAPSRSVDRVVAERGWVDSTELERLTGERRPATLERWVVDPEALAAALATAESIVDGAAPGLGLDVAGLDERVRALLGLLADVEVVGGRARRRTGVDPLLSHPFVAALEASPFAPPPPDGVDRGELAELVRRGLVIAVDGVWFAPTAVDAAARAVAVLLAAHPEGVTVAAVRDTLGTTRKYLLPLLAQLDASGVTRRRGDVRVAGPRLPALPPPAQGEL